MYPNSRLKCSRTLSTLQYLEGGGNPNTLRDGIYPHSLQGRGLSRFSLGKGSVQILSREGVYPDSLQGRGLSRFSSGKGSIQILFRKGVDPVSLEVRDGSRFS